MKRSSLPLAVVPVVPRRPGDAAIDSAAGKVQNSYLQRQREPAACGPVEKCRKGRCGARRPGAGQRRGAAPASRRPLSRRQAAALRTHED